MRINLNMSAVMTNKQLLRTENKLQASMERLSSGLKINSAADNPAGMAISNKMKAQIDGLNQAESNSSDATSVMQIADGALNEVSSILQRIRELSVQAANDTNTYADKAAIQAEINQLNKEIDRISTDTEFNTKTLLNGSSDQRIYSRTDDGTGTFLLSQDVSRIDISDTVLAGQYEVEFTPGAQAQASIPLSSIAFGDTLSVNGIDVVYKDTMTADQLKEALNEAATMAGGTLEFTPTGEAVFTSTLYGSSINMNLLLKDEMGVEKQNIETSGKDAEVALGTGFSDNATITTEGNRVHIRDNGGFTMDFMVNSDAAANTHTQIDVTDIGKMTIQIGSNQYQEMDVRIPEISTESMYLDEVDVTVVGGGDRAIAALDEAIEKVSSVRARIGAFQNRLEYAHDSLAATQEDMTSAYSGLMDTDMAEEMTEYTQQNILDQAAISVLSQANDLPQQVLSLLS